LVGLPRHHSPAGFIPDTRPRVELEKLKAHARGLEKKLKTLTQLAQS
jgi:hypothetical protein